MFYAYDFYVSLNTHACIIKKCNKTEQNGTFYKFVTHKLVLMLK